MSDFKYGSNVKNGKVSLTLVRNPIYPDPKADRGWVDADWIRIE